MTAYLDLPHGLVHFKDYGGTGTAFVMVHGLGGSLANWDLLGPKVAELGRALALDLPGFGLSPPGPDWSLETHAGAIIDLVEHLGRPAFLIGNSLGALLSEIVASQRPELVDGLVLISPATPPRLPDPKIHWPTARRLVINATPVIGPALIKKAVRSMTARELINDSLQRITHDPGRVPIEMVEAFVDVAEKRSHLPWALDSIPKTGQAIRRLFTRRSRFVTMIRDIKAPTLVVQGIDDPIISPTSVEWMCGLRPDWVLVQMEDTGHTPQIDAPIRTWRIIEEWLSPLLSREMSA